jgi:hypothetical protein
MIYFAFVEGRTIDPCESDSPVYCAVYQGKSGVLLPDKRQRLI